MIRTAPTTGSADAFHGAGRNLATLDARWSVGGTPLGDYDVDAPPSKIQGERHADRPSANDQYFGLNRPRHYLHPGRFGACLNYSRVVNRQP